MNQGHRSIVVGLAVALLLPLTFASASAQGAGSVDVIVVLEGVANPSEVAREHRVAPRYVYEHALTGFAASIPEARLRGLEHDPRVAYVSEDRPVQALAQTIPTGVSRIDAPKVHGETTGAGVRVAIIDTGIDSDHPDLVGNLDWGSGYDCINADNDPEDDQGHGTHVAGTVAASDNDQGVVGVAPGATLVAFKVLGSNGSGSWASVLCGVDKAAALNADGDPNTDIDVANLSLGGTGTVDGECGSTGDALYQGICNAVNDAGIAFTVAAGNDSQDASGFLPAAYPEVITVSAYSDTDGTTKNAGCSGRGPWKTCDEVFAPFSNYGDVVDVIAPGVKILSTTYDGGYGEKSGTSMAAPHVAGLAALVLQGQALTPAQLEAHLRDTGQCPDTHENAGTGDCTGQGTWDGDPDAWTEPMGNAVFATSAGADANQNPSVTITSPNGGAVVSGTVSITADATDDNGVTQVEFRVDGTSIGIDTDGTDGWSINWDSTTVADGGHTVSATATDTAGQTAMDSITVTVDNVDDPPSVSITSPTHGSTVSGWVSIAADATDDRGVAQVEFRVDGTSIGIDTDGTDGWSINWDSTTVADGGHTVSATATDTAGQTATDSISVTVANDVAELTVTGVDPSTVAAGQHDLTITGTGFTDGASVLFEGGKGPAPDVMSVSVVDANKLVATISVKSGGPSGYWDVRVTSGGTSAVLPGGLYVAR